MPSSGLFRDEPADCSGRGGVPVDSRLKVLSGMQMFCALDIAQRNLFRFLSSRLMCLTCIEAGFRGMTMRASLYVGRVGGLAVALGVGAASAVFGVPGGRGRLRSRAHPRRSGTVRHRRRLRPGRRVLVGQSVRGQGGYPLTRSIQIPLSGRPRLCPAAPPHAREVRVPR